MSSPRNNAFGQPIGPALPESWTPPPAPSRTVLTGRYCRVEPIDERFTGDLYDAITLDADTRHWTYLPYGPFSTREQYQAWLRDAVRSTDPLVYAIVPAVDSVPAGIAAYLRITPASASIEVGHLFFSQRLRRTPAATEAMYLMMKHAFGLGYRRYEWKCDALNEPSRVAALRLGFTFEGIFRQATVYKGRSRDTAWFSIIDAEWPRLARAFETWLDASNFDAAGRQKTDLRTIRLQTSG